MEQKKTGNVMGSAQNGIEVEIPHEPTEPNRTGHSGKFPRGGDAVSMAGYTDGRRNTKGYPNGY